VPLGLPLGDVGRNVRCSPTGTLEDVGTQPCERAVIAFRGIAAGTLGSIAGVGGKIGASRLCVSVMDVIWKFVEFAGIIASGPGLSVGTNGTRLRVL